MTFYFKCDVNGLGSCHGDFSMTIHPFTKIFITPKSSSHELPKISKAKIKEIKEKLCDKEKRNKPKLDKVQKT